MDGNILNVLVCFLILHDENYIKFWNEIEKTIKLQIISEFNSDDKSSQKDIDHNWRVLNIYPNKIIIIKKLIMILIILMILIIVIIQNIIIILIIIITLIIITIILII